MECRDFARRLEAISSERVADPEAQAHARECEPCRRSLDRALRLTSILRDLPRVVPPNSLDERVLDAASPARPVLRLTLVRAGAAVLLLCAAVATAIHLSSDDGFHRRLELRLVEEGENGVDEDESALREIFGPEDPLITAMGGVPHDR